LHDCRRRFGSPYAFERAYTLTVGNPLPAGADHTCAAAMDALHAAVIQRPTIKACTTEILGAIAGFESGVHYHGADGHFLQSLGYAEPMVDLGKVIDRFLLPVRRRMQASNKDCKLSQSVACVVLKGKWRSPHHSVNDAWMLYESFKGLVELLDSVIAVSCCLTCVHLPRVLACHRLLPMHLVRCVSDVLTVVCGSTIPADPRRLWRCETGVGSP
jgi:hypothetical protein